MSKLASARDDSRRLSVLLGLMFGFVGMGSAAAALALPDVSADMGVTQGVATWTITLYVLMFGVTTAVYGRISDLVGIRPPLLCGLLTMTVGSVIAISAQTFEVLLIARMIQGAGAAAVPTLGVAIISARYEGRVRGLALGRMAGVGAAVGCLGPLAGGLLVYVEGWRAVMAVPVCSVCVLPLVWRALTREGSGGKLDVVGAVLVTLTGAGLVLLLQSPSSGIPVAIVGLGLLVLSAPAAAAWVRHRPSGFLPVDVAGNAPAVRSALGAAGIPAAWFAYQIAVPAVMIRHGWELWEVGLLLVPSAVVACIMPRTAARLLARLGPSRSLGLAAITAFVALLVGACGAQVVAPALLICAGVMVTVAFGLGQPALMEAVGNEFGVDVRGVALGLAMLVFMVGGSIGSAVIGGIGEVLGLPASLVVLSSLPIATLVVLGPGLRRPHFPQ